MVYLKENYNFPRFQNGSNIFQEGSSFSQGPMELVILQEVWTPCPPLDPHMYIHWEQVSFIVTVKPVLKTKKEDINCFSRLIVA